MPKKDQEIDWPELKDLLDQVSDIFVEWRYATFDGNHLNIKVGAWDFFGNILKGKVSQPEVDVA